MKSKTLPSFWKCFEKLPAEIQELAREKYRLWQSHPFHASLQFKEVRPGIWSIRITQKYRAIGLTLEQNGRTFSDRYNLPEADYAAHGGCFPIHIAGTGIIGAITVSGLTQREDHNLVVEALCLELKKDHDALALSPPS